jgi:hypothetical protein
MHETDVAGALIDLSFHIFCPSICMCVHHLFTYLSRPADHQLLSSNYQILKSKGLRADIVTE